MIGLLLPILDRIAYIATTLLAFVGILASAWFAIHRLPCELGDHDRSSDGVTWCVRCRSVLG